MNINYMRNVWANNRHAVGDIVKVDGKTYRVCECTLMHRPNYYGKPYQLRLIAA